MISASDLIKLAEMANNRKVMPIILGGLLIVTGVHATVTHVGVDEDHEKLVTLALETRGIKRSFTDLEDDVDATERRINGLSESIAVNTAILKRIEKKLN